MDAYPIIGVDTFPTMLQAMLGSNRLKSLVLFQNLLLKVEIKYFIVLGIVGFMTYLSQL